jgi:SSS family solute:Na+ symporter
LSGLLGLLAAGMLAGFMSTHDSYLLAFSGVITQDIVAPLCGGRLSDRARIAVTRILILVIGLFLLIWGLWYELKATLWDYMALTGTVYFAGALPVLIGGLYWRRASSTGAMMALLAGLIALAPIFNSTLDKRTVALLAFALAPVLMVVFSLLVPDPPRSGTQQIETSAKEP